MRARAKGRRQLTGKPRFREPRTEHLTTLKPSSHGLNSGEYFGKKMRWIPPKVARSKSISAIPLAQWMDALSRTRKSPAVKIPRSRRETKNSKKSKLQLLPYLTSHSMGLLLAFKDVKIVREKERERSSLSKKMVLIPTGLSFFWAKGVVKQSEIRRESGDVPMGWKRQYT